MDEQHAAPMRRNEDEREPRRHPWLPEITRAERDFWRRAVAEERRRERCGAPAPFPFQAA
jgi:hypothetical protein